MKNALAVCWLWCCVSVLGAQGSALTARAMGTGQTTGHIADLIVTNALDEDLTAEAQWCFIPGRQGFQSYVARIPAGIVIPAGGRKTIPLIGYCTDVSTPPVPAGQGMPPVSEWVPIEPDQGLDIAEAAAEVRILAAPPMPAFRTQQVDYLRPLSAFKVHKQSPENMPELRYPGTSLLVGGTYAVNEAPRPVAPYIVACVQSIEKAVKRQQNRATLSTPFSNDPLREREAIVQQTIWIAMAALVGETYTQDDFTEKIYAQYQRNTGTAVSSLPITQRQKLDDGIAVFWRAFLTTGTAAEVFK